MEHYHFKLFKPYGYLSQFKTNARHERNKKFLGELYDFPEGTMAIGRLDKDSEGLLLLTTDGKVSYDITSSKTDKEYYVQVDGDITNEAIVELQQGVTITHKNESYVTKPCKAFKLEATPNLPQRVKKIRDERHGKTSWISITINEGKFRQVRKMTAQVGFPTLRLVRVRIGTITLNNLEMGEVNKLISIP
ncbi:pseudouridine synthase [uncultured Psychroserpens sp.]|uniref:pseudouridine synthase n=1 Tax=uncultured Psychroserpens sp. TaxID=255436 RepID=UPI002609A101|nr:pseudouridine synthase [uncultured Psychroserpens sp.]